MLLYYTYYTSLGLSFFFYFCFRLLMQDQSTSEYHVGAKARAVLRQVEIKTLV